MNQDLASKIADAVYPEQREWPVRIGIAQREGANHAFALEAIAAGDVVLEIGGVLVGHPDRYSVQIGERLHLKPPAELSPDDDDVRYRWRFLNHSCLPNAAVRGTLLVAVAPIAKGEEVTFDYNTTELENAAPFEGHFGAFGGGGMDGVCLFRPPGQRP